MPFNNINDNEVYTECIEEDTDTSVTVNITKDGPKLSLFTEEQTYRPLVNNSDLDPDDNYFIQRPIDHGYNTPLQLASLMTNEANLCSLMHINCRSIATKTTDIQLLLQQLPIDILAVTETWLDKTSADAVQIPGYNFVHTPRDTGRGGGVGFFIRETIDYQLAPQSTPSCSHTSYESLFIRIPQLNNAPLTLGVIYRPPGHPLQLFNEEFNQLLENLTETKRDIILMGDFNIDL